MTVDVAAVVHEIPELIPDRDELGRYLEDTIVVDWQTPAVLERARSLGEEGADELSRARAAFEFVRDEIAHSFDIETDAVPCSASQVLREETGLCYAKCHLLAALLRARGIPCGFVYQRLRSDAPAGGFVLHGLLAAWLPVEQVGARAEGNKDEAERRWVLLDPRGNNDVLESEFRTDEPSLCYEADPEQGEALLPSVLARPAKRVVDLLDYADSLARIRNHLPDSIEP